MNDDVMHQPHIDLASDDSSSWSTAEPPFDVPDSRDLRPARRPMVEIGWVMVGTFDKVDEHAIRLARERVREYLRAVLPQFSWRLPLVLRADPEPAAIQTEPIRMIDLGVAERQSKGWDFSFSFSAADFRALAKEYALGTPAQGLDAAAISTARLDPAAQRSVVRKSERGEILAQRIWALFLHLFGDLIGLEHSLLPDSPMYAPRLPEDLDDVQGYTDQEIEDLAHDLMQVADLRVEETAASPIGRWRFTVRVLSRSGGEVWAAMWRNRPWLLVWHLSKFTAAALSIMLILLLTAEVWDVGVRLPLLEVGVALIITLSLTTFFVVTRQRLLTRRVTHRLTEQIVVTDLAIILTVLGAMITLALLLIILSLGIIWIVPGELSVRWTDFQTLYWRDHLALAGMVSVVGLIIGALGASIEDQDTFRHIAFIDEET